MKFAWVVISVVGLALLVAGPAMADEPPPEPEAPAPAAADPEAPAAEAPAEKIEPTKFEPCDDDEDHRCARKWICPLKKTADGKYECKDCEACAGKAGQPCATPRDPCAYRYDPCRPGCYTWKQVPCYRTICCPKYEKKEIPCYVTRRVPKYKEIEVDVYTTKCVPITRTCCDPCTGELRTIPCGYRTCREKTGTETRKVICGYDCERVQTGTRTICCRVGYEQKKVVCGYRWCCVPVGETATAPAAADQPPMEAPKDGAAAEAPAEEETGCRDGYWVTVTSSPNPSSITPLPNTKEVITEEKYNELRKACEPCQK